MNFKYRAEELKNEITEIRRLLHRHPELSGQEYAATRLVCRKLKEYGVEYRKTEPTGVIAEIRGKKAAADGKRPCIALRADMDALPMEEHSGVPFSSECAGVMHSCGHDFHTAMLLGAAKMLREAENEFSGTVRLLFQPAEENASGAKAMISQGALEGVDAIYGEHIGTMIPCGVAAFPEKESHAAADMFTIRVHGCSGHGARPNETKDATVAAAAIVLALQSIVSRETMPQECLVVTVGQIHSGTRFNVISGEAWMDGTCRAYSREINGKLESQIRRIAENTAEAYGCTAEVDFEIITEVLVCDRKLTEAGRAAAGIVFGPENVKVIPPTMGGEDFSFYTREIPGTFARIGAGGTFPGGDRPGHCDRVVFDEGCLVPGAALYAQMALHMLKERNCTENRHSL